MLGRSEIAPQEAPPLPQATFGTRAFAPATGTLRMDFISAPEVGQMRAIEELTCRIVREHPQDIVDYVRAPAPSWLEAGSLLADDRPSESGF